MRTNRITVAEWKALLAKQRRKPKVKAKAASPKPKRPHARKPPVRITWRISTSPGRVVLTIEGLRLVSEMNMREHHMKRFKRKCAQQNVVHAALVGVNLWHWVERPLRVTIVRTGPRKLDKGDNLESCGKHVRDQLAEELGVDDGSSVVDWRVDQKPIGVREYAVEIVVESAERKAV